MAGDNKYTLPFSVDMTEFFKGFKDGAKELADLKANVVDANNSMKEAFTQSGKASDDLRTKIRASSDAVNVLKGVAKEIDLTKPLRITGAAKELDDYVKKFNAELSNLQKGKPVTIGLAVNDAQLKELEALVSGSAEHFKVLADVVAQAQAKLATLDPNSQEWEELSIQLMKSDELLKRLAGDEEVVEGKSKSLKAQLREMKAALAEMELAGKGGTAEFVEMSIKAGELEDQIGDVSARVKVLASDTKYLDASVQAISAIAGGFAVAQGAAALFGSENEKVNEAIKKVSAAMAVLQGIQAIANALNKDSALRVLLFSKAQATQVVTTEAVTVATEAETVATVQATAATNSFTLALLRNPFVLIAVAIAAVVAAIVIYISTTDDASLSAEEFNAALELQNATLETSENMIRRRTALLSAQAKAEGKSAEEIKGIEIKSLQDRLEAQKKYNAEALKLLEENRHNDNVSKADEQKAADDFVKGKNKQFDLENQLEVARYEAIADANKKRKEDAKKALEDSKKNAEEEKKVREQVINFTKVLQDSQLSLMKDGYEKDRQQARNNTAQKLADLNKDKALSEEAQKVRADAVIAINKGLSVELANIDSEEIKERSALQLAGAQMLIDLRESSLGKELDALALEQQAKEEAIREQFKNETSLQEDLIQRVGEDTARKRDQINLKYRQEEIDKQESAQLLLIELSTANNKKSVSLEQAKQADILRVQLQASEARLQALKDAGAKEDDLAVTQAALAVANYKAALKDVGSNQTLTLFSILGLDKELSDKEKSAINSALKEVSNSISEFTDFYIDQYQRQIDAREENISKLDDELGDLKDRLDKEKDYQEQGFAANTALIEDEIAEKQKQKDEEVRLRNEAFEEQQKVQKLQIAADSLIQGSALVTAAANIIKGFSTLPFVGQVLGAISVAAMIAGFVASKAKALQAVNQAQPKSFGQGGWIDGPSHEGGGVDYYSESGNVQLEGNEYVTRKTMARKYGPLLEAVNSDDISRMNEDQLRGMLSSLGIRLSSDDIEDGISEARANASYYHENSDYGSKELKSIDGNISLLVKAEKNRVERWEDQYFYYERRGNSLKKTRK